ncbi:MAG: HupE/UreJ family protein [Magnetococcales bacterium]|nr:HupE/UreJ family protein [Magnetococcales bacterium]
MCFLSAFLLPSTAFAHIFSFGEDAGFMAGLGHPVLGYDHLLAMVSVGMLSAQMGGRAIWTVPAAFVSVMVLGGVLGLAGMPLPGVEYGIALSILGLGIAIASEKKLPTLVAMIAVGIFAIFHGHAHGTEIPKMALPLWYVLGFMTGTSILHLVGVGIGWATGRMKHGHEMLRFAGAGIATIGLYIMMTI